MRPIENQILQTLKSKFAPVVLEVTNESDLHQGPKGRESHFKVYLVSESFTGTSRLQRQREVFAALAEVMGLVHALALKVSTPEEHTAQERDFQSPQCASKRKS